MYFAPCDREPEPAVYDTAILLPEDPPTQQAPWYTHKASSTLQHSRDACDAEQYSWLLPPTYGLASNCSSTVPPSDGMLSTSELHPSPGLSAAVEFGELDMHGGQETSMSGALSIEPDELCQASPPASPRAESCDRSLSDTDAAQEVPILKKEESDMDVADDSGSFHNLSTKLPGVRFLHMHEPD